MTAHGPDRIDVARRGDEIYAKLRGRLEAPNLGKFMAIDVRSADYTIADTAVSAAKELRSRRPNAEVWLVKIGSRTVHRIGRAPSLAQQ